MRGGREARAGYLVPLGRVRDSVPSLESRSCETLSRGTSFLHNLDQPIPTVWFVPLALQGCVSAEKLASLLNVRQGQTTSLPEATNALSLSPTNYPKKKPPAVQMQWFFVNAHEANTPDTAKWLKCITSHRWNRERNIKSSPTPSPDHHAQSGEWKSPPKTLRRNRRLALLSQHTRPAPRLLRLLHIFADCNRHTTRAFVVLLPFLPFELLHVLLG